MRFTRAPYRFDLSLTLHCHMPDGQKRVLLPAAKAALNGLPAAVLKRLIRPDVPYALNVAVVGEKRMHTLNSHYRKKDRPTDVLSFSRLEAQDIPFVDPRLVPEPEIGEIILCWPVARRQAGIWESTVADELRRLVVHGVLHLFGYDHETDEADARRMFRLQERILKALRPAP